MRNRRLQVKVALRAGVAVALSALLVCPGTTLSAFAEGEPLVATEDEATLPAEGDAAAEDPTQDVTADDETPDAGSPDDTPADAASAPAAKKAKKGKGAAAKASKKKDDGADEAVSKKQLTKAERAIAKMTSLTTDLEMAYEDLNEVNDQVDKLKKRIKKLKASVGDVQGDLTDAKENLSIWVKESYVNGQVRYLSVLLGATSFEDFASRMKLLDIIVDNEVSAVERVRKLQSNLTSKQQELTANLVLQKQLKAEATEKAEAVQSSLAAQAKYFEGLPEKVKKKVLAYDGVVGTLNTAAGDDGVTTTSGAHPEVVTEALKYLGVKYVWGGETPAGFDCSGLTMYCYAKLGISLTHFARTQYDEGVHVSYKALMPGDLVFFGSSVNTIHHVGIYMGNDKYIHAPQTGDVVKISTLSSRSDYVGACRPQG